MQVRVGRECLLLLVLLMDFLIFFPGLHIQFQVLSLISKIDLGISDAIIALPCYGDQRGARDPSETHSDPPHFFSLDPSLDPSFKKAIGILKVFIPVLKRG